MKSEERRARSKDERLDAESGRRGDAAIKTFAFSRRVSVSALHPSSLLFPAPLHQIIDAVVFNLRESQPLEEAQAGIEALDVDGQRLAGLRRFRHQLFDKRRSHSLIAIIRQDGDVEDANLSFSARDVEPTDGMSVKQNEVVSGCGVVCLIMKLLCCELHLEERFALRFIPGHSR